jgi:hypothetical protein
MKAISVRDFEARPDEVWEQLQNEHNLLVTDEGRLVALLLDIDEDNLAATLVALRQARAQVAVVRLRRSAVESGRDQLSTSDIEAEIAASRRERSA